MKGRSSRAPARHPAAVHCTPMVDEERGTRRELGEPRWHWLQRNRGVPAIARGLTLLTAWLRRFPPDTQPSLRARLESRKDTDHESAVFEIYMHAVLSSCGYEVVVEPQTPGGSRPDFLVGIGGLPLCYVEATTSRGDETWNAGASSVYWLLEQAVRRIQVPGFQVWVEGYTVGAGNAVPRQLAGFLNQWFRESDHAEATRIKAEHGVDALPEREFTADDGWSVRMRLWPLLDAAQIPDRLYVALGPGEATHVDSDGQIKRAIDAKQSQHRSADLPLVIAYASNDFLSAPDGEDVANALLGTAYWAFPRQGGGEGRMGRHRDGAWSRGDVCDPPGPAGLIVTGYCQVEALPDAHGLVLWENPFLRSPALPAWPFDRVSRSGDRLVLQPGASPVEALLPRAS